MKLNPATLLLTSLAAAGAVWLAVGQSTPGYEDQLIGVAVRLRKGKRRGVKQKIYPVPL
jgi:hypothetical protein